jgi:putative transcriptional regulator
MGAGGKLKGRLRTVAERPLTDKERAALAATDWEAIDAMTDEDIARQIADNPDAAPDLSEVPPEALRVVRPNGGVAALVTRDAAA